MKKFLKFILGGIATALVGSVSMIGQQTIPLPATALPGTVNSVPCYSNSAYGTPVFYQCPTQPGGPAGIAGQSITPQSTGGNFFLATGFPSSCTVSSIAYTTQADCAYATEYAAVEGSNVSATLYFPAKSGGYNSNVQWVLPDTYATLNIVGDGINSTIFNQTANISAVKISKPLPSQPGHQVLRGFSIKGNSDITGCMTILGAEQPDINFIDCSGVVAGSDHDYQFGDGNPGNGIVEDAGVGIHDLFASAPYGNPNPLATITATLTGTSITAISCGANCGTYDSAGASYMKGVVLDPNHSCTTLPAFNVSLSGSSLVIGSITNAGNCTALPYFQAYPVINISYGIKSWISDSVLTNLYVQVGSVAGIALNYGDDKIIGAHPVLVPTGILDQGNNAYFGTECDEIYTVCIDYEGTGGSTATGTVAFTALSAGLPGQSVYFLGSNYTNFGPQGTLCTGKPTGWHEFLTSTGPVYPNNGWNPLNKMIGNDQVCQPDSVTGGDYIGLLNSDTINAANANISTFTNSFPTFNGFVFFNSGFNVPSGQSSFYDGVLQFDVLGTATSSANFSSAFPQWQASIWNGTAATVDNFRFTNVPLTGTNPETDLVLTHPSGSSGAHYLDISALTGIKTNAIIPASARRGTFTCTGAGTITISNSNYAVTSDVTITMHTAGGTITTPPAFKTVTGGTGFSVLCGATDTSVYNYSIWN